MLILWRIRCFDRTDEQFKDRSLFLDTDTLPAAELAAVELIVEMRSARSDREFLRVRTLFSEVTVGDLFTERFQAAGKTKTFALPNYFEDETGGEIDLATILQYLRPLREGDPRQATEAPPVPLAEITLAQEELRLLGYFTRDFTELEDSALMREGPGTLNSIGFLSASRRRPPIFQTSLTDDEIRSFVLIFRRLYMESEPANLRRAVDLFVRVVGDHPYAQFVSRFAADYENQLNSDCKAPPFLRAAEWKFTTKRLIDVFLYTQYVHQPDERRQRQFNKCLAQLQGDRAMLTWLFLYEIWLSSIQIVNAGRAIDAWFQTYCAHHGITPDVLNSLRHEGIGFAVLEKEVDRKARLFREKIEELEMELWKQAGRPEGGPAQFRAVARDQLNRALGGEGVG